MIFAIGLVLFVVGAYVEHLIVGAAKGGVFAFGGLPYCFWAKVGGGILMLASLCILAWRWLP